MVSLGRRLAERSSLIGMHVSKTLAGEAVSLTHGVKKILTSPEKKVNRSACKFK